MQRKYQSPEKFRANHLRLIQATISVKDLKALLNQFKPIMPENPMHRLLGCVKLESANGELKATATDLSNFIVVKMPCNLSFRALVRYDLIMNWLQVCPQGMQLHLETSEEEFNSWFHIRATNPTLHYQFNFEKIELFPELSPELDTTQSKTIRFEYEPMMALLKSASKIASTDETKPAINNVRIVFQEGNATIQATDGHTFIERSLKGEGEDCKLLINKNLIQLLSRLKDRGSHITFTVTTDTIDVSVGEATITSFLVKEDYPSFAHLEIIMPQSDKIIVDRKNLINALKRCGSKADKNNEETHKILLTACPDKSIMQIQGLQGTEEIPAQVLGNNPDTAILDIQLLSKILKSIQESPQVAFNLGRNKKILTLVQPFKQDGHYGLMGHEVECELPYELRDEALVVNRGISFETAETKIINDKERTIKVTNNYKPAVELPYEWRNGKRIVTKELKESWTEWNPVRRQPEQKTVHFVPEQLTTELNQSSTKEFDDIPSFSQFFTEHEDLELAKLDEEIPTFGEFFTD